MALNKTDKYGVPISYNSDERMGLQQPKFTNRFRVHFRDFGTSPTRDEVESPNYSQSNNILTAQVESFNKPNINFSSNEVTSFIGRAKYSGRPKTESFTIVIRDEITNTVVSRVYNQIKMQTYKFNPVTRFGGSLQKSIMLGFDTKFDCIVETMDGRSGHSPLETWVFRGCFIENVENTGLSYDDDNNVVRITLQCQFDYFEIYQNERVMFPQSYNALDNKDPQTIDSNEQDDGFFDSLSEVTGNVGDVANTLFNRAKDSFNSFVDSDEFTGQWDRLSPFNSDDS